MDIWTIPHPTPYSEKGVTEQRKNDKSRGGEEHTKLVIVLQELVLLYRSQTSTNTPAFLTSTSEIFKKRKYPKNRCCIPVHKPVFSPARTRYPHNNVAD
jgi:hypothetical protein